MKQNMKFLKVVVGATAWLSSQAYAAPTLYPKEITKISAILNNTNSNIVMDDTDPNKVFVLPPNTAEAQVGDLHTITANVIFCEDLKASRGFVKQLNERYAELTNEATQKSKESEKLVQEVIKANTELGLYTDSADMKQLVDMDSQISDIEAKIEELYEKLNDCQQDCTLERDEAKNLMTEKRELMKERRAFARSRSTEVREYERRKNAVERAKENLSFFEKQNKRVFELISENRNHFETLYSKYGKLMGARASFKYTGSWDKNLETLKASNTGFSFEKIQTSNVNVYPSIAGLQDLPSEDAILSFDLPGRRSVGAIQLDSYPDSFNANIALSLIGTCPLLKPMDFGIENDPGVKSMKYGLAVTYDFPTTFNLKVTAKYNMHKLYQKIVQFKKRGGFFSSRTSSSVDERNEFKDEFSIDWSQQDASNSVTEEQRLAIEKDLRHQIFTRIANMAIPTLIDRNSVLAAAKPGPHGAVVLAEGLQKVCPTNVYCNGGALILNVLDSVFGKSSRATNITSLQDIQVTETWSRDLVTSKPWITIYNP